MFISYFEPKRKTSNEGVDAGARRKVQKRSSGKDEFQSLGFRQTSTRQSNRHNEQGHNSVSSNSDSNLSVTQVVCVFGGGGGGGGWKIRQRLNENEKKETGMKNI